MKIHNINSVAAHGNGRKSAMAPNLTEQAKDAGQNQPKAADMNSADIKQDPSRLPEPARLAPAHVARTLLTIQVVDPETEEAKNFGQLVAQVAKGEQAPVLDQSSIQQANILSDAPRQDTSEDDH